jgi:anti-anti-sigma factor
MRLTGDIDLGNWADIRGRMAVEMAAGIRRVDLTGVRYFGAAGVRVVLDAFEARPSGATVHVTCAPSVFRVMRISGLLDTDGLVITEAAMQRQSPVEAGE